MGQGKNSFWEVGRYGTQNDGLGETDTMGRTRGRRGRKGGLAEHSGQEEGEERRGCSALAPGRGQEGGRGGRREGGREGLPNAAERRRVRRMEGQKKGLLRTSPKLRPRIKEGGSEGGREGGREGREGRRAYREQRTGGG